MMQKHPCRCSIAVRSSRGSILVVADKLHNGVQAHYLLVLSLEEVIRIATTLLVERMHEQHLAMREVK
jgi:hypothetical protein